MIAAVAAHRSGDTGRAERLYRERLAAEPADVVARFNLGTLLLGRGEVAEAALLIARALGEVPQHPLRAETVRALALALFRAGHWEIARPWLEEARLAAPVDAELDLAWTRARAPAWLEPEVHDPLLGETLRRGAPREAGSYVYTIDIVGTCNLRCPSCPVGNLPDSARARGFMDYALFERIVDKLQRESPAAVPEVWLFNWGEPLLHPEAPRFLRLLRERGLPAHLSTNLNIRHGLDEVVAAAPATLKVSISGFSAATYADTHRRGHLELVVANLHALRAALDRHRVATRVWVGQHVYRGNQHEVEPLAALCRGLGFEHQPIAAFYQPLEKLIRIAEGEVLHEPVLDQLLEHPASYLPRFAATRDRHYDCELRSNQTVINHDGTVALCCSVYEPHNQLGLAFVDAPRALIEQRKYAHPTCATCQRLGLAYAPMRLVPSTAGAAA
jgi:MoaA/NifB/PqqE/SkfB family radical SAM enzyme